MQCHIYLVRRHSFLIDTIINGNINMQAQLVIAVKPVPLVLMVQLVALVPLAKTV